jgi:hypothetical protein
VPGAGTVLPDWDGFEWLSELKIRVVIVQVKMGSVEHFLKAPGSIHGQTKCRSNVCTKIFWHKFGIKRANFSDCHGLCVFIFCKLHSVNAPFYSTSITIFNDPTRIVMLREQRDRRISPWGPAPKGAAHPTESIQAKRPDPFGAFWF